MTLIEQIRRDRGAGTPGPWVHDKSPARKFNSYSDDVTGSIVSTCDGFEYAPRPDAEKESNARRIARVPAMEDALLAADAKVTAQAAEIDRLKAFIEELRDYEPEIHSGRMSDPQDDVPDVIEADVFLTFQEDAITALGEQS